MISSLVLNFGRYSVPFFAISPALRPAIFLLLAIPFLSDVSYAHVIDLWCYLWIPMSCGWLLASTTLFPLFLLRLVDGFYYYNFIGSSVGTVHQFVDV